MALGEVVGGVFLYDREGSSKLLLSSHDRERDRGTFKGHFCWDCLESVSFGSECVESLYFVDFAVGQMVMVIFSGIALLPLPPPLVHLRESPEFSSLASPDKSAWRRFMLYLVFLVMLGPLGL